jgi:hypothetical protein
MHYSLKGKLFTTDFKVTAKLLLKTMVLGNHGGKKVKEDICLPLLK